MVIHFINSLYLLIFISMLLFISFSVFQVDILQEVSQASCFPTAAACSFPPSLYRIHYPKGRPITSPVYITSDIRIINTLTFKLINCSEDMGINWIWQNWLNRCVSRNYELISFYLKRASAHSCC
jgi:hypothetical protein